MKSKTQKQEEAAARQEAYDKLTWEQKLARAKRRGHTGTREAKRLVAIVRLGGGKV